MGKYKTYREHVQEDEEEEEAKRLIEDTDKVVFRTACKIEDPKNPGQFGILLVHACKTAEYGELPFTWVPLDNINEIKRRKGYSIGTYIVGQYYKEGIDDQDVVGKPQDALTWFQDFGIPLSACNHVEVYKHHLNKRRQDP